uniref:Myosin motor domain-containing protein n=1 Tax=Trichuris muris TaxID=70415 RepID=A0A5S6Q9V9_TRIMR
MFNGVDDGHMRLRLVKGAAIWIQDPVDVWRRAKLLRAIEPNSDVMHVELDNGEVQVIQLGAGHPLPFLRNPDILLNVQDLTTLSYMNEPDVLFALKSRFELGHIYTYCGIVLVAINPYHECDLYNNVIKQLYCRRNVRQLDPHIYAVAEEAFASMNSFKKNQSVIVSGESGAGKTVSAKHIMEYLAYGSNVKRGSDNSLEIPIDVQILASNPLIEAFGNAKTNRNDNSSRFGKFMQLLFDNCNTLLGARLETYLLEKCRVVAQGKGERNYHIFYQLCAARDKDPLLADLSLSEADDFYYLQQGEAPTLCGVSDLSTYEETKRGLQIYGFSEDDMHSIFRILAGLLHWGNLTFLDDAEVSYSSRRALKVSVNSAFHLCTSLLMLNADEVTRCLTTRTLQAGHEKLVKSLNASEAAAFRDAMAKCIYERLFAHIVERINKSLFVSSSSGKERFIGVLDIYGFEIFDANSFEQLCINYANEVLQQQFNKQVFKREQEEYVKESIEWSYIDYVDNQHCLDLIEGNLGIYDLLDQECKLPSPSDSNWFILMTARDECSKSAYFDVPKIKSNRLSFFVKHFAGTVNYTVDGFTEKNLDSVNVELYAVLKNSKFPLLARLLCDKLDKRSILNSQLNPTKKQKLTVAFKFRQSLEALKCLLDQTMLHYVRCIKPNDEKKQLVFDNGRVIQQLRACGVMETIRISAAGFPSRWKYEDFFRRYSILLNKQIRSSDEKLQEKCEQICRTLLEEEAFRLGRTQIFFRSGQVALLESARLNRQVIAATLIQKVYRGHVARKRFLKMRRSIVTIQNFGRAWLAWRWTRYMQMNVAAIFIQCFFKMVVARNRFLRLRSIVITIQRSFRANKLKKRCLKAIEHRSAVIIQKNIRMWLARRDFVSKRQAAIVIQSAVRRWLAQRETQRLREEMLLTNRTTTVNFGLENKVIQLHEKLTDAIKTKEHYSALSTQAKSMLNYEKEELVKLQHEFQLVEKSLLSKVNFLAHIVARYVNMDESVILRDLNCSEAFGYDDQEIMFKIQQALPTWASPERLKAENGQLAIILEQNDLSSKLMAEVKQLRCRLDCFDMEKKIKQRACSYVDRQVDRSRAAILEKENKSLKKHISNLQSMLTATDKRADAVVNALTTDLNVCLEENREMRMLIDLHVRNSACCSVQQTQELLQAYVNQKETIEQLVGSLKEKSGLCETLLEENARLCESAAAAKSPQRAALRSMELSSYLRMELDDSQKQILELKRRLFLPSCDLRQRGEPSYAEENREALESLGMLFVQDADAFVTAVVKHAKYRNDEVAESLSSSQTALLVVMVIRYYDHTEQGEKPVIQLLGALSDKVWVTLQARTDLSACLHWFDVYRRLLGLLHQYSEIRQECATAELKEMVRRYRLRSMDTVEVKHFCTILVADMFQKLMKECIEPFIIPLIVPGLIEYECEKDLRAREPLLCLLLHYLDKLYNEAESLDMEMNVLSTLFCNVTSVIASTAFKEVMYRANLCNFTSATRIRHNLSSLGSWLRRHNFTEASDVLQPLFQVTHLLQARKDEKAVSCWSEMCSHLTVCQIVQLLRNYTPMEAFESKPSPAFIRFVEVSLRLERSGKENEKAFISSAPAFYCNDPSQFTPSCADLGSLDVPLFLRDCARKF